ncbi:hypothetical protein ACW9H6_28600 [Pseudomonas sp. SDO528_S397]
MEKLYVFLLFLVSGALSATAHAGCYGQRTLHAPDIMIDLSDKLNERNRVWTTTVYTKLDGLGDMSCSSQATLTTANGLPLNNKGSLGIDGGKYWIRAEIIEDIPQRTFDVGKHAASKVNVPLRLRFSLVEAGDPNRIVTGDTGRYDPAVIISDETALRKS